MCALWDPFGCELSWHQGTLTLYSKACHPPGRRTCFCRTVLCYGTAMSKLEVISKGEIQEV